MANKIHCLKTFPLYFEAIKTGVKKFEARFNDRNFHEGDVLVLQEFEPSKKEGYTGECFAVRVDYILNGPGYGLADGYCVMSITPMDLVFREANK